MCAGTGTVSGEARAYVERRGDLRLSEPERRRSKRAPIIRTWRRYALAPEAADVGGDERATGTLRLSPDRRPAGTGRPE